jgi:hypothetical protein
LRVVHVRVICVCVGVLIATLAVAPADAQAVSPILEFVTPASAFPVSFTADGGEVTAALADFDTVVHCSGSHGEGEITGSRSTLSNYVFTGCETEGGSDGGSKCKSEGANEKEIVSGTIEAELVYIDQARHEVGMLLDPHGGTYLSFECGGESVKALGSFLAPGSPINEKTSSFTVTLSRSGATQTPGEYENANGEKLMAIPIGERGSNPPGTTGVELGFTIHTNVPIEVKAVTASEIEAAQRAEAAKKKHEEEAAAAKKRQEEEAASLAAATKHREERARARMRARRLSKALRQCRKLSRGHRRARCETRARKRYGGHRAIASDRSGLITEDQAIRDHDKPRSLTTW